MKKILISVLLLVSVLVGTRAGAEQAGESKATNVKIHKKQELSDLERKAILDKVKGKPTTSVEEKGVPTSLPATGILGASLPVGGERYAIVIGLANYVGTANDLCVLKAKTKDQFPEDNSDLTKYCQDYDSVHMRDVLNKKYGFATENIIHLHDGSATEAAILAAMESLKNNPNLDEKDEVVFFFSGHGTSGNYGAADEALDEGIYVYDGKVIWDDQLKAWADSLSAARTIFTFDICLAGGMSDLATGNSMVVMSSQETQNSWTYYLGGFSTGTKKNPIYHYSEGLFSRWFVLEGMTNGLADGSNLISQKDGKVVVEEAFGYTYPIVYAQQIPVIVDNFANDLLL